MLTLRVFSLPNVTECIKENWFVRTPDPSAPHVIPINGQQVFIKNQNSFCINLPDPSSQYLHDNYYGVGLLPNIVEAEGYVRAFCYGPYLTPNALPMPNGAILSAHVTKHFHKFPRYYQIYGLMDCKILRINCTQSFPGAYDDGGQYDNVPYRNCGKEPYSGTDKRHREVGLDKYVEKAGDGEYCMRICEGGMVDGDPCNSKTDELGCMQAFKISDIEVPGFDFFDF
ncbi:hypothetical protein HK100_010474 [Physocladia obscura]|uniref:Uncharacterized protein n=1 Tax=Physocladia obscura TaxID=109957 RepID=A0AAD5TEU0_9FUNG|nr:hypothetical protein HK100_010474 [Physocladia obscura]